MRRSKAPSMRLAAKRESGNPHPSEQQEEPPCSWPSNSPQMAWGSSKSYESLGLRELKPGENPLRGSRIYHVLWRNQTTKKHKTWTGNGTLVVTGSKMTLKDDSGLVVDTATCFKPRQIKENDQLQIGSRDVEVQEEFQNVEECAAHRKLEIANWCKKIDTQNGHVGDTESPPVVNLPFRSHVLKKRMRQGSPTEVEEDFKTVGECPAQRKKEIPSWSQETNPTSPPSYQSISWESPSEPVNPLPPASFTPVEYLCLLAPAQLQEKILHFLAAHSHGQEQSVVLDMVHEICDHPVLLKTRVNQPDSLELMQMLKPRLPPWTEMGLYDSAKFEFVHLMLDDLVVERGEKCCIVANSQDCLRLVMGYCENWDISHVQLNDADQVSSFNQEGKPGSPMVALALTSQLPGIRSLRCKYLIIYNHNARRQATNNHFLAAETKIYTLVTSGGSPEEQEFYRSLGVHPGDATDDLESYRCAEPPYTKEFLQEACISDSLESLQRIYLTKNET
ncbi:uncharacterized protein LOC110177390 [Drosophila serrata]|uniref:uncharacterized protein LOC110177390 n=1 Tax=Drosophila serrata TaxID=7274 RepID=UPI000A1D3342|nr:uncharacterized protein LOC110177390 [Drosophila serrata]